MLDFILLSRVLFFFYFFELSLRQFQFRLVAMSTACTRFTYKLCAAKRIKSLECSRDKRHIERYRRIIDTPKPIVMRLTFNSIQVVYMKHGEKSKPGPVFLSARYFFSPFLDWFLSTIKQCAVSQLATNCIIINALCTMHNTGQKNRSHIWLVCIYSINVN